MAKKEQQSWHLYIVRCKDGSLYTGITKDVKKRIALHNANKGAKYTRGRTPVALVFRRRYVNHRRAAQAEIRMKRRTKADRERIISA